MANRYTRRAFQNQYNPVSFEQFAQAPMMAQALHDRTISEAMAQQEYMTNLPWHEQKAREVEGQLEGRIDKLTNKITNSDRGIYDVDPMTELSDIRSFKREKFMPVKTQIELALKNRQDLKKRYQDLVDKGDATSMEMREALAIFDKQSAQAVSKGTIGYDGRVLAIDPGINKMIVDYISKLPSDKIYQETGWRLDPQRGVWVNQSTGIEQNETPAELQQLAMNYISQDPKAMAYFQDRAMVAENLYAQYDPNSESIIYNGKYYNPDEFRHAIINEQIANASTVARPFSFRKTEVKENIKNLSDWQIGAYGLDGGALDDVYFAPGSSRPSDFSKNSQIKRVFRNSEGEILTTSQVDQYIYDAANLNEMSPSEQARFKKEIVPQLRKKLNKIVQESDNLLTASGKLHAETFSSAFTQMKNVLRDFWGADKIDNLSGIMLQAYENMAADGVNHPKLTTKEREDLRKMRMTKLQNHRDIAERQFAEGSNFKPQEFESSSQAESVYSSAFENTVQPPINGFVPKESKYLDPNMQEAARSNSLASLVSANSVMVVDENNEVLYGEEARDWMENHSDVDNISQPTFITTGLNKEQAAFLGGSGITVGLGDGKFAQVIIPSNSNTVSAIVQPLRALSEIEGDYNMSLDGQIKSVVYEKTNNMEKGIEYINTVQNGQAVQILKPYYLNSNGEKQYYDDGNGNAATYDLNTFREKYIFPNIQSYLTRGANFK